MSLMAALWVMSAVVVPSSSVDLGQRLEHADAGLAVERAGRLVAQQNVGPLGDGAGDGDALLLATRHLRRKMVHALAETDEIQRRLRAHRDRARSPSPGRTFSRAVSEGIRL